MEKGYWGYGKYDQLRKNIPYSAFAAALRMVIRQLITESSKSLALWKEEILRALGSSGAILTELIPELELIVGAQPQVEALRPQEAQNRFLLVLEKFLAVFASRKKPLVLFLDDLQWANAPALRLLAKLSAYTNLKYLLIVCAYRDNEITPRHPLHAMAAELRKAALPVQELYLYPLNRKEVTAYLAETLHCSPEKVSLLAESVYRKTSGNPFFLGQMLKTMEDEKIIFFDSAKGGWTWKPDAIYRLQMPADVLELLLWRLQKLPRQTLEILKTASCMGSTFDLQILAAVCRKTMPEVQKCLTPALREGLISQVAGNQNEFLHDRIEQAVHSLLSEQEAKQIHLEMGRMILQQSAEDSLDEQLPFVLDHINRSLELIADPGERLQLARLNFKAGIKAKASADYNSALNCLAAGVELLGEGGWQRDYQLCFALHLQRAACEYMLGNEAEAEKQFLEVEKRARTAFEKAELGITRMRLYSGGGKHTEAVQVGLDTLKLFGYKLPLRPSLFHHMRELAVYKWLIRNKKSGDLLNLPEVQDSLQKKAAQLFVEFILATCTSHPDLYALMIVKSGNFALKHGVAEVASIGFLGYSILEGSVLGNFAKGCELAGVGEALAEKYGNSPSSCIVYFTIGALILHWTAPAKEGLVYLQRAAACALEAGNVLIGGYAHVVLLENKYLMGVPLEEVLAEVEKCKKFTKKVQHENLELNIAIYGRMAAKLKGEASSSTVLEELYQAGKMDKASQITYLFTRMQFLYLTGEYRQALAIMEEIKPLLDVVMGFLLSSDCNFYHSLVAAACYEKATRKEQRRLGRELAKNQRQMKKWALSCPANFSHKYLLVEAERARLAGRREQAEKLYDDAIASAREGGFLQNEALACELAGKYYAQGGRGRIARVYLTDAYRLYTAWGAAAKAQSLQEEYPDLIAADAEKALDTAQIWRQLFFSASQMAAANGLELCKLDKAVEIIAQADPAKLAAVFLEIAAEVACANRGFFIMEKDNELFVEAALETDSSCGRAVKGEPVAEHKLSEAVVFYSARIHEAVVLNDTAQPGIFAKDPYLAKAAGCILCLPLELQGIPLGVLYLENTMLTDIFTEERIELLKLLTVRLLNTKEFQAFLEHDDTSSSPLVEPLTERELEVLRMMAAGLSNKEITDKLDMSINTVKTHIKSIYSKLQVTRRVQAVKRAEELELL